MVIMLHATSDSPESSCLPITNLPLTLYTGLVQSHVKSNPPCLIPDDDGLERVGKFQDRDDLLTGIHPGVLVGFGLRVCRVDPLLKVDAVHLEHLLDGLKHVGYVVGAKMVRILCGPFAPLAEARRVCKQYAGHLVRVLLCLLHDLVCPLRKVRVKHRANPLVIAICEAHLSLLFTHLDRRPDSLLGCRTKSPSVSFRRSGASRQT